MSFGANSSKSSQTSQSQSQSAYDPGLLDLQKQGVANAQQFVNSTPYTPYSGAPLTYDTAGLNRLTNYTAPTAQAAQIAPGAVPTVQAGQIGSTDLSQYMNPFQQGVIDTSLADINRQRGIADQGAASQATQQGAFGGSRSAVLQNLTDDSYARAAASTIAGLNAQNFSQAQGAAGQDIAGRLQASLANQSTGLNVAGINAGNAQQTALANQSAGLAGGQLQLAGQQLAGSQAENQYQSGFNQYLNSQQYPLALQQYLTAAYGLLPSSPLSTSSSSGSGSGSSFGFTAAGPK